MKELVRLIAQHIVDRPESVTVSERRSDQCTVFELKVYKPEMGRIIGKRGQTAQAIRTLLNGLSAKQNRKSVLEIVEAYDRTDYR